jgi:hypothetical protein
MNARRHDADYGIGFSIHSDVSTDNLAVRAKMLTPQTVAEYHYVVAARPTLLRKEIAPEHHRQSFHREKPGCPL